MKTPPLIRIEWCDASSQDEWQLFPKSRKHQLARIFTVGYLLRETPCKYVVAHSVDITNKAACGVLSIPKGCVQEVTVF